MQILDFIKNRRSVHKYKKKKVPLEALYYVLEAGRWAPSSANIQNWRFLVIQNRDTISQIARASLGQEWISDAPLLIIVCSLTKKVVHKFHKFGEIYAIQNTMAAVENMLIGAMGVGLATCWVTAFAHNRVRRICRIPDQVDIHGIITLGYANERPVPMARHDLWDLTIFEHWFYKDKDTMEYLQGEDKQPLLEKQFVKDYQKKIKKLGAKVKKVKLPRKKKKK